MAAATSTPHIIQPALMHSTPESASDILSVWSNPRHYLKNVITETNCNQMSIGQLQELLKNSKTARRTASDARLLSGEEYRRASLNINLSFKRVSCEMIRRVKAMGAEIYKFTQNISLMEREFVADPALKFTEKGLRHIALYKLCDQASIEEDVEGLKALTEELKKISLEFKANPELKFTNAARHQTALIKARDELIARQTAIQSFIDREKYT
jgi:hypothetical protein